MLAPNVNLAPFPNDYPSELRTHSNNPSDLIVSLSSGEGFAFYKTRFDASVLFLEDRQHLYYMRRFNALYAAIGSLIEANKFERVLFLGVSKGGWASLVLSHRFAAEDRARDYRCLAFSPQTHIWPQNAGLAFPSYRSLIERSRKREGLKNALAKYGRLPELSLENLNVAVYYGAGNGSDAEEAARLTGNSVELFPLPTSGHLSHLPFVFDASNRQVAAKLVDIATRQGQAIGDGMPEEEKEQFVDELVNIGKQPSVAELVRAMLNWTKPVNLVVCVVLCDDFVAAAMAVAVA